MTLISSGEHMTMTGAIYITQHAIERYQQRVQACNDDDARTALSSPTIMRALAFGCPYVKLGTGQRIVIEDGAVITVLPIETLRGQLDPRRANATGMRRLYRG